VIPLLGIYLKDCAPGYDRATWTPEFIVVPFIIAKFWKYPICPKTNELNFKNVLYIYNGDLFSHKEE
jgi:hypothetical protein